MKPEIIPRNKMLEFLLKGNEVLHVYFSSANNTVNTVRLTKCVVEDIKNLVDMEEYNQGFFVALIEDDTTESPELPEQEDTTEKDTEKDKEVDIHED